MLLQGGPSHLDLWDPKPERPGRSSRSVSDDRHDAAGRALRRAGHARADVADKIGGRAVDDARFTNHIAGTYITLTGSTDQPDQDREAKRDDFPGPGAVLNYLNPGPSMPRQRVAADVAQHSRPVESHARPVRRISRQRLRPVFDLRAIRTTRRFSRLALSLPEGFATQRMQAALGLARRARCRGPAARSSATLTQRPLAAAARTIWWSIPACAEALDLTTRARCRARSLRPHQDWPVAAAGSAAGRGGRAVRCATTPSIRSGTRTATCSDRYKQLIPPMDQAFAALVDDLAERGLLDDTLVINTGEFGRTPIINKDGAATTGPTSTAPCWPAAAFAAARCTAPATTKGRTSPQPPSRPPTCSPRCGICSASIPQPRCATGWAGHRSCRAAASVREILG